MGYGTFCVRTSEKTSCENTDVLPSTPVRAAIWRLRSLGKEDRQPMNLMGYLGQNLGVSVAQSRHCGVYTPQGCSMKRNQKDVCRDGCALSAGPLP